MEEFSGTLSELGGLSIELVKSRRSVDGIVWRGLIENSHYLESSRLCGGQIRYLVKSEILGYIGALSFSSGTYALKARDVYIGWSEGARVENLKYVVLNSRFLIRPEIKVKNLASHVLSLALERLLADWEERYHIRPLLVETFVNPEQYKGTSYQAANWRNIGKTSGRRDGVAKDVYVYPLRQDWQERLCKEPLKDLRAVPPSVEAADRWVDREFGTVRLLDNRLKNRLCTIVENFYNRPLANIPEACGSHASSKGAYRFFNNKKVTMDVILTPHVESTITRIRKYPVVLAPQDTTTLRYTHPDTEGLGPINTSSDNAIGMILHDTVAFSEDGTPLGVLDAQCWVRDIDDRHKRDRRKSLPIQEKESMKWLRSFQRLAEIQKHCPETQLISIGDRESDIYELFLEAQKHQSGPKLLVRANRCRERRVEDQNNEQAKSEEQPLLWDYMKEQTIAGELQIHVPRKAQKPGREAIVEVRFSRVTLQPPKNSEFQPLNNVWAVYVIETGAEDIDSAIEWMLLTTVEVHTFEEAEKVISWCNGRWGIEVYHRTLKSGCRIEDRQLGSAESLQACLGIDMVIAWRIYHLTMLGREIPEHPCTVFFEEIEWKSLWCLSNNSSTTPAEPPTLRQAIRMLGQLGGHLGRKSDGMPGTECIWRGLQRLDSGIRMYSIFTGLPLPKIWDSYPEAWNCPFSGP